jgi:charged multivesicular body protein 4
MLNTGNVPVGDTVGRLPTVPTDKNKTTGQRVEEDDEEEELRKLQAEMAM